MKPPVLHRAVRPGRGPRSADNESRERLLDSAVSLFAQRGISNTTVAQIAAASNVTSAMVHYWFTTRETLLDAVVDERVLPLISHIWKTESFEGGDMRGLILGMLSRMLEITQQSTWLPALWLREIIQEGGLLRDRVLQRIPRDQNVAFRTRMVDAQRQGEIPSDIAPELLFLSMLGLVMLPQASALGYQRIHPGPALERERLERHVQGLLTHGLFSINSSSSDVAPRN